jgi:hypothetical protein
VEKLCMAGAKAVQKLTAVIFLRRDYSGDRRMARDGGGLRARLRLTSCDTRVRSPFRFPLEPGTHVSVHHFEHDIAGRPYQIEVMSVGSRWRAQLRRTPGMPTALMPFYGATPEEAAGQLTEWLSLAHRRQSGSRS